MKSKKIKLFDIIVAIALIVFYFLYFAFFVNIKKDFSRNVSLDYAYKSVTSINNCTYVIFDDEVLKLQDGQVQFELQGTSKNDFASISNICVENDDSFYVHSIAYSEGGFSISNESIIKYDASGHYVDTPYSVAYDGQDVVKGQIFDMQIVDGGLEFIQTDKNGFKRMRLFDDGPSVQKAYEFPDAINLLQNFAIDQNSKKVYVTEKCGRILCADDKGISEYCKFDDNMVTPYDIDVDSEGSVYFTDVHKLAINKILPDGSLKEMISKDSLLKDGIVEDENSGFITEFSISHVRIDGVERDVISTLYDDSCLYSFTTDGEVLADSSQYPQSMSYFILEIGAWILIGLCALCALYLLLRIILVLLFNKFKVKLLYKIEMIIIVTTIVVTSIIIPIILPNISKVYVESLSDSIFRIATIASKTFDADVIDRINSPRDFMNDDYKKLKAMIEKIFINEELADSRLGGQVSKYKDGVGFTIAYQSFSDGSYYPVYPDQIELLKNAYETKAPQAIDIKVSNGHYVGAAVPILNSKEDVVGVVICGKDSARVEEFVKNLLIDILVGLCLAIVTLIFIINEIIAFLVNRKTKVKQQDKPIPFNLLRVASFMFNFSINMSVSFLPIFILMFESDSLGIPKVLAGTLPLFINSIFIYISALICPRLLRTMGFRGVTCIAAICSLLGNAMLALLNSYYFMALGLLLNGLGFGLLDNSIFTYLAGLNEELNKDEREISILNCSAGVSAGVNCGLIIGAFLAVQVSYSKVFLCAACIDFVSLLLCIYLGTKLRFNKKVKATSENVKPVKTMSAFEFLFLKKALLFILLLSVPYQIIFSFVYYYLPIYGSANGLDDMKVSLLLVMCALSMVFLKVGLTKAVSRIFKKNAIYIAGLIGLLSLLCIAAFDSFPILVVCLLILGVAFSFGAGVLTNYFLSTGAVREFGEDRALGIMTFISGLGYAFGATIFGVIIEANMLLRMGIFALVVLGSMVIYKFIGHMK